MGAGSFTLCSNLVFSMGNGDYMHTLTQLRIKHWSGRNTLYPRHHRACSVEFKGYVNHKALLVAQDEAHDALQFRREGDVTRATKHWNRANFFLTGAYVATNDYWEQF